MATKTKREKPIENAVGKGKAHIGKPGPTATEKHGGPAQFPEDINAEKLAVLEEAFMRLITHLTNRRLMPYEALQTILEPLGIKVESPNNPGVFIYDDKEKRIS